MLERGRKGRGGGSEQDGKGAERGGGGGGREEGERARGDYEERWGEGD